MDAGQRAGTAAPAIQQGHFAVPATPSPRLAQSASVPTVSTGAVTGSATGWTATGGTPIVLAKGETLNTISGRYGVPVSALVAANGFGSAAEAQPGSQNRRAGLQRRGRSRRRAGDRPRTGLSRRRGDGGQRRAGRAAPRRPNPRR